MKNSYFVFLLKSGSSSVIIPLTPNDDNHLHDKELFIVHTFIGRFFFFE